MFGPKKVTVGLEVGPQAITLVQVEQHRLGKRIFQVATRKVSQPTDEAISEAITKLFRELKIGKARLITSIPRHLVTVRFLKLPSAKESEISQMVDFQIERQIPYPREEVISDYQIVGVDPKGYSNVMLVIVHRDVVSRHLKILKDAGLEPRRLMLSSQAIASSYLATPSARAEPKKGALALIDPEAQAIEIDILHRGRLVFTRGVSLQAPEPSQEGWQARLVEEVGRTLSAYEKEEKELKVARAILLGPIAKAGSLVNALSKQLPIPVKSIKLLEELPIAKELSLHPGEAEVSKLSLAAVIGQALDSPAFGIELLPPKVRMERELVTKRRRLISAAALLIAILLLGSGIFSREIYQRERYLGWLKAEVRRTDPKAREVKAMMEKVRLIRGQLDTRGSAIDILSELHRIVPPESSLTIFIFDEKKLVTLRGTSYNMSDVFELIAILEGSPYFQNVEVKYASRRKAMGKEFTDFQITCPLVTQGVRKE